MVKMHAISCGAGGDVLIEHIPLEMDRLPGAPMSDLRWTLDLTHAPDAKDVAKLLQVLMLQQALTTWILVVEDDEQGYRCHGKILRCSDLLTTEHRTLVILDMHLVKADDPLSPFG
jgi:hypothetical protein